MRSNFAGPAQHCLPAVASPTFCNTSYCAIAEALAALRGLCGVSSLRTTALCAPSH